MLKIPSDDAKVPNDEKVQAIIKIKQSAEGAVVWPELDAFTFQSAAEPIINNNKENKQEQSQ